MNNGKKIRIVITVLVAVFMVGVTVFTLRVVGHELKDKTGEFIDGIVPDGIQDAVNNAVDKIVPAETTWSLEDMKDPPPEFFTVENLDYMFFDGLKRYSAAEQEEIMNEIKKVYEEASRVQGNSVVNKGVKFEISDYYFSRDIEKVFEIVESEEERNKFIERYTEDELSYLKDSECFGVFTLEITNTTDEPLYDYGFNSYGLVTVSENMSYRSSTGLFDYGTYRPGEGTHRYFKPVFEPGETVQTTCIFCTTIPAMFPDEIEWFFGTDDSSGMFPRADVEKLIPIAKKELVE